MYYHSWVCTVFTEFTVYTLFTYMTPDLFLHTTLGVDRARGRRSRQRRTGHNLRNTQPEPNKLTPGRHFIIWFSFLSIMPISPESFVIVILFPALGPRRYAVARTLADVPVNTGQRPLWTCQ